MRELLPLAVVVPLLAAAAIAAMDHVAPQRVEDAVGVLAAAASFAICLLILIQTQRHDLLEWFGGWRPRHGIAIGISFVASPLGAGMATLASGLATLALLYSWTYLHEAARLFDVLMLLLCGAMVGFALTGDLFNMFVWVETVGVAAYALAGFRTEQLGPIQGAVNFAITNTLGGYMILFGIALLYSRTAALDFGGIGEVLSHQKVHGLTIVALTLLFAGFMVKAAVVPFHLWLADAHAVAPVPVCILYSGAMLELGLFGIARLYWTVFDGQLGPANGSIRSGLVWIGVVTALLGAAMSFLQRHLKRMLAYSTVAHLGVMLVGVGLLAPVGLAGAADLALSHGLLKGGLFLLLGVMLLRLRGVDELRLHGRGRGLRVAAALWGLGALGLVGIPYAGDFLGRSLIIRQAEALGFGWVPPLLMISAGVSAGSLARAGARVFLGWGPREDPLLSPEPPEEPADRRARQSLMLAIASVAVVLGLVVSVVPGLTTRSERAAERFQDRASYVAETLHGHFRSYPRPLSYSLLSASGPELGYGFGALAIAVAVGAFGLWRGRLPNVVRSLGQRLLVRPVEVLKLIHSGIVGDYLLWIVIGAAALGGAWALALR